MSVFERIDPAKRTEIDELRNRCYRSHWWELSPPHPEFTRNGLFVLTKYVNHWCCQKCTAYRSDGIDANGGLLVRRYKWPEGYLRTKDEERPTSDELRLWVAKRNRALGVVSPRSATPKPRLSEELRAVGRG